MAGDMRLIMGHGNDFVPAVAKNIGDSGGLESCICTVVVAGPLYGRPAGIGLEGAPTFDRDRV